MKIDLSHEALDAVTADWLLLGVTEAAPFSDAVLVIDAAIGGALSRLKEREDITGKHGELVELRDVPGIAAQRVLTFGLGKLEDLTPARLERSVLTAVRKLSSKDDLDIAVSLAPEAADKLGIATTASRIASALVIGCVGQGIYRAEPDRFPFRTATVVASENLEDAKAGIEQGLILGEAVNLTRELVNRHPHDIVPETFADRAAEVASALGIHGEILDEHALEQEKMTTLLAVARGSDQSPRVVSLEYRGGGEDAPILALCGKGVTFDSGGLSLKPSDGMKAMKADMAGAATVLGAMTAIARLKLPVNVLGVMGLVENMPSAKSYKLGEVLTARNGVTIEVHNTDAEGRLVLADVLAYAVDHGAKNIVDLATLTGACVVALGEQIVGAFTNDQDWCDEVLEAARNAEEEFWQLPMSEAFNDQLKSDVADVKNVGTRWGGAITAAKFLEHFVDDCPWVHLDIAGPAFAERSSSSQDGGGTGVAVRTLVELARQFGEKSA